MVNLFLGAFVFIFNELFSTSSYMYRQNHDISIMFLIYCAMTPVFFVLSLLNICFLGLPAEILAFTFILATLVFESIYYT